MGAGRDRPRREPHGPRARPARSRRLGQTARRLLARRLRQRRPGPHHRAGPRARDGRRPLARRRDRDAVRLPVPRAGRAPRAHLERRPRARGPPDPPRLDPPRLGDRPRPARAALAAHHRRRGRRDARASRSARRRGPRRRRRRTRVARRRGRARRVRPHRAGGDRPGWSARVGDGPPLPRGPPPDPDRLGRARSDHPGRARRGRARRDPRQPPRDLPGAGHFPHREQPVRFVSLVEDFVRSTEPAAMAEADWNGLLRVSD